MKPNEIIANALDAIDPAKRECEDEVRRSIDKFIKATGVRPTGLSFGVIDVSADGERTRSFLCDAVTLDYESDVRFPSAP